MACFIRRRHASLRSQKRLSCRLSMRALLVSSPESLGLLIARARITCLRIDALSVPAWRPVSSRYGTAGTSTWMSMRSSSGPESFDRYLSRRPPASAVGLGVAAGRGVHRRDQHELGGKFDGAMHARHRHLAALQRLAERLQHVAAELRQLVEKQDAMMRHRHLPRPRDAPAAHQRLRRRRMMRRAHRPLVHQRHPVRQQPHRRINPRRLQRFPPRQRRQNPRNPRRCTRTSTGRGWTRTRASACASCARSRFRFCVGITGLASRVGTNPVTRRS